MAAGGSQHFVFRWSEGERVVMLVSAPDALYSALWDTASALNPDVLATFVFRR